MTLGELRKAIEGLPDDLTVMVEGGEWDYREALTVDVQILEWHDEDTDDEDGHATQDRLCLIVD